MDLDKLLTCLIQTTAISKYNLYTRQFTALSMKHYFGDIVIQ